MSLITVPDRRSRAARGGRSRALRVARVAAVLVTVAVAVSLAGCSTGGSDKSYDISPVFPLDAGKCARYDGDQEGSGITASCYVTKDECDKAASDWNQQIGSLPGAITFKC